ncbi:MAG: glycosyl hydrolase family 18 protein [Janthinobacterium lividum]
MRAWWMLLVLSMVVAVRGGMAQGTVPVFQADGFTLAGVDPATGGGSLIPVVLVPIRLVFEVHAGHPAPVVLDAAGDVERVRKSPVFAPYPFAMGGTTQYADALLRSTLHNAGPDWHTLLDTPSVRPVTVTVPRQFGYVLTSKKSGHAMSVVDIDYVQKQVFQQVPRQQGSLVIALTHNTAFYAAGDATVCCSWGSHGVDTVTGNSFVLSTYLHEAPSVVTDQDVQPLTQQLAEFVNDPLHEASVYGRGTQMPGNTFAKWERPGLGGECGWTEAGSAYFMLEPTDTNPKNNLPASAAYMAQTAGTHYHLENVALLPWYRNVQNAGAYSFPDAGALTAGPKACGPIPRGGNGAAAPTVVAAPQINSTSRHQMIGYWASFLGENERFSLRDVSPQWDVIIVAFSNSVKDGPEGAMDFKVPRGMTAEQFKSDVAYLKSKGKKVMVSLGGGGAQFALAHAEGVPNFVSSVTEMVDEFGFDGIDIDFESPALDLQPGDTNLRQPTSASTKNMITALRQLKSHFGKNFMISLVPEGTQVPAGYPTYGGQFGSYLPLTYALRDVLSFVDVQDYNTPPLQGLDGEIYQPGSVDYHVAMTELMLRGFPVGHDPKMMFPGLPPEKVAVGFLTEDTNPGIVNAAMDFLITGRAPAGTTYRLQKIGGYPALRGAMFWTMDADRGADYVFSNSVGPKLHAHGATK